MYGVARKGLAQSRVAMQWSSLHFRSALSGEHGRTAASNGNPLSLQMSRSIPSKGELTTKSHGSSPVLESAPEKTPVPSPTKPPKSTVNLDAMSVGAVSSTSLPLHAKRHRAERAPPAATRKDAWSKIRYMHSCGSADGVCQTSRRRGGRRRS